MIRKHLILVGLGLTLLVVSVMVIAKETQLRSGRSVFLALAPVDPRSLIQGDYMALRYAISNEADRADVPPDGHLVLVTDERGVATFRRIDTPATPLAPGELLLRYRRRADRTKLGAEAYYFEEGRADVFANAAFGELKVTSSGQSVLVGLRDKDLNPLK